MRWPSARFYKGQLIADPSVAHCLLSDLDSVTETQETKEVLYLIDTAKITDNKYEARNNKTFYNTVEAIFVIEHLKKLLGKKPTLKQSSKRLLFRGGCQESGYWDCDPLRISERAPGS